MGRTFTRTFEPPSEVDVLDWTLIEEIGELFGRYRPENPVMGRVHFQASDSRGTLEEYDLADFRQTIEQHTEEPWEITISLYSGEDGAQHGFTVWWSDRKHRRGSTLRSDDEAAVVYVADRLADMFERARLRQQQRLRAAIGPAVNPGPPSGAPANHFRRIAYNPWLVGKGTTVLAAGIIALIVSLTH